MKAEAAMNDKDLNSAKQRKNTPLIKKFVSFS